MITNINKSKFTSSVSTSTAFKISYFLNQIKQKGNIVYEYNPFRNYRLTEDLYEYKGAIYSKSELEKMKLDKNSIPKLITEAGTILDLDTEHLNFSLNNPVELSTQYSYDGSVNIIFNDNRNIPRLINSRFSTRQNNTYEVIDRVGNNDTNIYDDSQFDIDSSLYKRVQTIPNIDFQSVESGGNLKVGNYVLYFTFADADDNETDFVGESGVVSCFKGNDRDPFSIDGGFRDENSNKSIRFFINNIDEGYDYLHVYYTRTFSDINTNRIIKAYKVTRKFIVRDGYCNVLITGDEDFQEIPLSDINVQYFIANTVKSQTVCQNMLFLGNITKPDLMYQDLTDISLRMFPFLETKPLDKEIGNVSDGYIDLSSTSSPYEYYNTKNIYHRLGYWDEEIYRFGVVYIMNDGSLSPVYNVRGMKDIPSVEYLFNSKLGYGKYKKVHETIDEKEVRQYLTIDESTYEVTGGIPNTINNSKGVCRVSDSSNSNGLYSIGMFIPEEVLNYLQNKVSGLFFVRQKRIPTILAQAYVLPYDLESNLPVLPKEKKYYSERFLNDSRIITNDYNSRLGEIKETAIPKSVGVGICPEFEVRQPYFNQLFTGTDFYIKECPVQPANGRFLTPSSFNNRYYNVLPGSSKSNTEPVLRKVKMASVPDSIPIVQIGDTIFRAKAGEAEEAHKFRYLGSENKKKDANNLVRGLYSAYLGMTGDVPIGSLVNIYIPGYSEYNYKSYFGIRYEDSSAYYPISDRISIEDIKTNYTASTPEEIGELGYYSTYYRGDCYICNYTHRLNRNFQDPESPNNDEIVDADTWKDSYDPEKTEDYAKINRGDINAVQLGSWITLKVRSSVNLSVRSLDASYPEEEGLVGLKRGFYPLQEMSVGGNYKIPSSEVINMGFSSTTGEKQSYSLPDVPYLKNNYDTRILYSNVSVSDAFKNGFRVFKQTNYRDYPMIYGGIMKMVELFGSILCVFEHGVALIPVNERAVAGEGAGGNVFINTSNVLPENPKMLSDTYGTQWAESVIKTPYYVYGVDTIGKKIWRTNGSQFEIISDFKIQQFLNRNISLSERELSPIIGVRNVKSHYNAFKQDVMFTFYDNLYGFEEKVWNICYNEVLQKWITFYSWVPSYSANIDNQYFSFNRDTSKWISKLALSKSGSTSANGIVLDEVVLSESKSSAILGLENRPIPDVEKTEIDGKYVIFYSLERDNFNNYKHFSISQPDPQKESESQEEYLNRLKAFKWSLVSNSPSTLNTKKVWLLNIKADIKFYISGGSYDDFVTGWNKYTEANIGYYQSVVAVTCEESLKELTTDFWKHGQSGIIDIKDKIKPCYWYGKQHPFEFEFVVTDNPTMHKIFNNLQIISNKAVPDSFHYEIVGEVYDFHEDKCNMYYRQEAIKAMYQNLGSDILFDSDYTDTEEELLKQVKSTLFPAYYYRKDTFNEIEDFYHRKNPRITGATYAGISGSEIVREELLDEYKIWTHSEALDIKGIDKDGNPIGRMRGNMNYQEDKWDVQIPSLVYIQKNEPAWTVGVPPLVVNALPEDIKDITKISKEDLPLPYNDETISLTDVVDVSLLTQPDRGGWTDRKETRLRDKYIKVRVRYSGEDLAIILMLKTIYTESYA